MYHVETKPIKVLSKSQAHIFTTNRNVNSCITNAIVSNFIHIYVKLV